MTGRNRPIRHHEMRGFRDGPYPHPVPRGVSGGPLPAPAYPIEEEIAMCRDECRRLVSENRHMLEEIASLKRENNLVKEELDCISKLVPKLRAAKEVESHELIQKCLKLEAEMRSLEPVKSEAMKLRMDLRRAESAKEEVSAKIKELTEDLKHLRSEKGKVAEIKAEIEARHQELAQTRMTCEFEKKAGAELSEQLHLMQKNLVGMAREAEQLRAELLRRVRGPEYGPYGPPRMEMGFPEVYGMNYGPDGGYDGRPWPSPYDPLDCLPLP